MGVGYEEHERRGTVRTAGVVNCDEMGRVWVGSEEGGESKARSPNFGSRSSTPLSQTSCQRAPNTSMGDASTYSYLKSAVENNLVSTVTATTVMGKGTFGP